MIKLAIPAVLVGIGIMMFLTFTRPLYEDIKAIRQESSSYNEALGNSKALEAERDKLTAKYNSIDPENLRKLGRLMPDGVDNIRLILEMEKIAAPYGMVLKDVRYDTSAASASSEPESAPVRSRTVGGAARSLYGTWNLEFSTEGNYENFLNFVSDIETNLRIMDISSVTFSSGGAVGLNPNIDEAYKYQFKIRTYWLKN